MLRFLFSNSFSYFDLFIFALSWTFFPVLGFFGALTVCFIGAVVTTSVKVIFDSEFHDEKR